MLLTKELYGSEFSPTQEAPFGLRCGQMRSHRELGHNVGWYNAFGEKIGWGDLSGTDYERIMEEIPEDELFITLSEQDSFWAFGSLSLKPRVDLNPSAPDQDYVARQARDLIVRNHSYTTNSRKAVGSVMEYCGISFEAVDAKWVRMMMDHYSELHR